MAVNKNFVVKNGLEVNNDLLLADSTNQKVGIGTSVPSYTLHVLGGIGATEAYITGVTTTAAMGGITTTGGDLYVGGDLFVKDDIVYDEVTGRNLNITGVATIGSLHASGVSTSFVSAVGIQSAGLVIGAGITQLNFIGAGNTFEAVGNTVNISIAGGGGGGGGGAVSIGATAPTSPSNGDLWYSINLARTFVWYDEDALGVGSSAFWVDAAPFNLSNKYLSRLGDNLVAGLGFTAGTVTLPSLYYNGDPDTGLYSPGANQVSLTAGGNQVLNANISGVSVTGIISATQISINGSPPVSAVAAVGLGTPIDPTSTTGLDSIYYTNRLLGVAGTVTVPSSADVAYTNYGDIIVDDGDEFIISDGDQFVADVLGIGSLTDGIISGNGVLRADQITGRDGRAPQFPSAALFVGVTTVGFITATDAWVGGGLTVGGNLNVSGDISYDEVTGRNLNITGVSTFNEVNVTGNTSFANLNATGITTSAGGFNIGIQSAGTSIATLINTLNFVGTGNTFLYNSGTNTVDISISGGGGGGGGGNGKTAFFASGWGGVVARTV